MPKTSRHFVLTAPLVWLAFCGLLQVAATETTTKPEGFTGPILPGCADEEEIQACVDSVVGGCHFENSSIAFCRQSCDLQPPGNLNQCYQDCGPLLNCPSNDAAWWSCYWASCEEGGADPSD